MQTESQARQILNVQPTTGAARSRERTPAEDAPATTMRVTKRNGTTEPVDLNKIVRAITR